MTLNQFRSKLYATAKYSGDAQAVRKGRIFRRILQRILGAKSRRVLNRVK